MWPQMLNLLRPRNPGVEHLETWHLSPSDSVRSSSAGRPQKTLSVSIDVASSNLHITDLWKGRNHGKGTYKKKAGSRECFVNINPAVEATCIFALWPDKGFWELANYTFKKNTEKSELMTSLMQFPFKHSLINTDHRVPLNLLEISPKPWKIDKRRW